MISNTGVFQPITVREDGAELVREHLREVCICLTVTVKYEPFFYRLDDNPATQSLPKSKSVSYISYIVVDDVITGKQHKH